MTYPIRPGTDYSISSLNSSFHWEGLGAYSDFCSEDGFATMAEVTADAATYLSTVGLPELPSPSGQIRLACFQDLERSQDVYALDLDSKTEVVVDATEAENFVTDCTIWDKNRFNAGLGIACAMAADLWLSWSQDAFEIVGELDYVPLTVAPDADGSISALCLTDKREVGVPTHEAANLTADCKGLDLAYLASDRSSVALMRREHWAAWLEQFEAA